MQAGGKQSYSSTVVCWYVDVVCAWQHSFPLTLEHFSVNFIFLAPGVLS